MDVGGLDLRRTAKSVTRTYCDMLTSYFFSSILKPNLVRSMPLLSISLLSTVLVSGSMLRALICKRNVNYCWWGGHLRYEKRSSNRTATIGKALIIHKGPLRQKKSSVKGIEPSTFALGGRCSTIELHRLVGYWRRCVAICHSRLQFVTVAMG